MTIVKPRVSVKLNSEVVDTLTLGKSVVVTSIDGNRVWIKRDGRGYVNRSDVVPWEEAIDHFTKRIQVDHSASNYAHRGIVRMKRGMLDDAINDLTIAIQKGPTEPAWHNARGTAWKKKGETDNAIADYSKAIQIDPKYSEAYTNRASLRLAHGENEKAKEDLTEMIRLCPDDPLSFNSRGVVFAIDGDYDNAIDDFTKGIEVSPECTQCYLNRAKAWAFKREYKRAIQDLEHAQRLSPKNASVLNALAWRIATCPDDDIRDGQRAIELAQTACELTEWKNVDCVDTLAASFAASEKFELAVKMQQKAIALAPEPTKESYRSRLRLYQQQKPYRE